MNWNENGMSVSLSEPCCQFIPVMEPVTIIFGRTIFRSSKFLANWLPRKNSEYILIQSVNQVLSGLSIRIPENPIIIG